MELMANNGTLKQSTAAVNRRKLTIIITLHED